MNEEVTEKIENTYVVAVGSGVLFLTSPLERTRVVSSLSVSCCSSQMGDPWAISEKLYITSNCTSDTGSVDHAASRMHRES